MNSSMTNTEAELLLILQEGIPLEPHPFAVIGNKIGLTEEQTLNTAISFISSGMVRRFGAVFEARKLGYTSTLCAVDIPQADMERLVGAIHPHTGITHCYERNGHPNLWLTMTAPAEELDAELAKVSRLLAPYELFSFPARRTFKIGVVLDVRHEGQPAREKTDNSARTKELKMPARKFNEKERTLIRILQDTIPLSSPDPLEPVARKLNLGYSEMLAMLAEWKKDRVIRRFGFIPRHTEMGFAVNAMCAWKVDAARVEEAGNSLARSPMVTHCYERIVNTVFPYNIFAMVHARTLEEAATIRAQLGAQAGLSDGLMMMSVREFKKTSPVFFEQDPVNIRMPQRGSVAHNV